MKICQQSLLAISQSNLVYSLKIGGTVMLLIETKKNGYSVSSIGECKVLTHKVINIVCFKLVHSCPQ